MKKIVIVIQARTNSSRLPGKVLLPIAGLPIAVLAAKRVTNSESNVIIATSKESSDDYLAEVSENHGVTVYRGDLNNVLKRFVDCLFEYSDETVVVRLTADNIFPDSSLIAEITDYFLVNKYDYLCLNGELSGLPYGVSAEVMTLMKIREAYSETKDSFDLEHVTPYIRRKYGEVYYKKYCSLNLGMLRCTVDNFNDYIKMTEIFSGITNPVSIPTFELIKLLEDKNSLVNSNNKAIVLGTVQFGLNYGINNDLGKPTKSTSFGVLSKAVENGVQYVDTANAYGDSEQVIGEWLNTGWQGMVKVITKLSPLTSLSDNSSIDKINQKVDESIYQSLISLGVSCIDVLMFHRAEHITSHNDAILQRVTYWKEEGKVYSLGVSVQSPEELEMALKYSEIEYIQLPFNILDSRWNASINKLIVEKEKRVINVHVRSVYLQGLLLTEKELLWNQAHEYAPEKIIKWLKETANALEINDISALCINYVISQSWVDAVVVGVDNIKHLENAFKSVQFNRLTSQALDDIENSRPIVSSSTLNPSLWKPTI